MRIVLCFTIIIIIAVLTRITDLHTHMPFLVDESRISNDIYQLLVAKKIPLLGDVQSNLRIPMGPLYYYVGMPALSIGKFDPRSLGYLNLLIGTAAVAVAYIITYRLVGLTAACITGITMALSMAFVAYSNKPFPPALLTFIVPLYYASMWQAIQKKTLFWILASSFLAGLIFHIHISGIIVLPLTIVLWIFLVRKINFLQAATASFGYLLALSPLLVFNVRHQLYHWTAFSGKVFGRAIGQNTPGTDLVINTRLNDFLALTVQPFFPPSIATLALAQFGIGFYLLVTRWKNQALLGRYFSFAFVCSLLLTYLFLTLFSEEKSAVYHIMPLAFAWWFLQIYIVTRFWNDRLYRILFLSVWAVGIAVFLHYHLTKKPDTPPLRQMEHVALIVAKSSADTPKVNILSLENSDILATPYRYFTTVYGANLLGAENFARSDAIYVLSASLDKMLRAQYTELYAGGPYDVDRGWVIGSNLKLYKLHYRHPGRAAATDSAWPIIAEGVPL